MVAIGYKAAPEQFGPNELLDFAIAAEEAGFDTLEASDHFNPWSEDGQACFVWTWLGAVAARTQRIEIGTGVTSPILRYNPAVLAQSVATLECMAPGRVFLGVGTGEALNDYTTTGQWPEYRERQDRLAEAIEIMTSLLAGDEISHHGEYYQTRKARLWTLPERRPPIWISSMVPESADFAGRHGDGLFTVGGKSPDHYTLILEGFETGARAAGKDPTKMAKAIEVNVEYADDVDGVVPYWKQYWAGTFIPALFDQKIYTPKMSAENGEPVGADTIKKMVCISANPDEHVQTLQQYIDLGFDRIYVHAATPNQRRFIERYGRDVLPRLKEKAGAAKEPVGALAR